MDFSSALRVQGTISILDGLVGWIGDGIDRDGVIDQGGGVVDLRLLYGGVRYVVQATPVIDEGDLPLTIAPVVIVSALNPLTNPNTFRLRAYDPTDMQAPLTSWSAFITVHCAPLEVGPQLGVAP